MKKIGLTGATGFIGTLISQQIDTEKYEIIPLRNDEENNYFTLDGLIHCARSDKNIFDEFGNLAYRPTKEQWVNEFLTDVYNPHEFTLDMLKKNKYLKNIIFISSIYGNKIPKIRRIPPNYLCCKAAERYLAKCLAERLGPQIRVNSIVLGGVESDRKAAQQDKDFKAEYINHTILNKMVKQDEIIGTVEFLLSEAASKGITGQEIVIDGGYSII